MTKVTIIADGCIQGAGCRTLVKQVASQIGLKGLVRNLSNGQVEIFCEGQLPRINKLLKMINCKGRKNDVLSVYVESLTVRKEGENGYLGPWKQYVEFEICYGFEVESPVDRTLFECLENRLLLLASL
jgi:acylphosphatase